MHDHAWEDLLPGLRIARRPDRPIERITVFGERCSGTHAIIRLVEANFPHPTFDETYGFKHWFVPPQTLFRPEALVIVVARAPVEWIQSLHRNPWHAAPALRDATFSAFIRMEWHSYWDHQFWGVDDTHPMYGMEMMHERDPRTGLRFANPIALRTAKLAHWSALHTRAHHVAVLDCDLVRTNPEALIGKLAEVTGLAPIVPFQPIDTYKGHGIKPFEREIDPPPCDADLAHIGRWLDPDIERLFGFGG